MAELVKFQQKTDSEIDATPVTDGLLMFSTTTGSGRIAMDYAGNRNEMGGNDITVDSTLSTLSENPVQNKVITEEINSIADDVANVEDTYTQSFPSCETYSPTATYDINDYVIYSDALYRCIVAITVGEAWNSAHWASINSTNIGIIYNDTDSSFYGRSGADSVLKKLNKTIHKYTFTSEDGLWGTRTVSFNITSISGYADLSATQMIGAMSTAGAFGDNIFTYYNVGSTTYNSTTGLARVPVIASGGTEPHHTQKATYRVSLYVFVNE